jgi:D-galactarolactone cycloisomerase
MLHRLSIDVPMVDVARRQSDRPPMTALHVPVRSDVTIARLTAMLFVAEATGPLVTSFGSLAERPCLCVQVEDTDGATGWGEIWCNFPPLAGLRRAAFAERVIAPFLEGRSFERPSEVGRLLLKEFGTAAVQAGEEGLLASVAAGIDQSMWDLVARRHRLPLWRLFGGSRSVAVYASGVQPETAVASVEAAKALGHVAFKVKVGFDDRTDLAAVTELRDVFGDSIALMLDANQAWSARHALDVVHRLAPYDITWLEEPLRLSEPSRVWLELAAATSIPLAAGENIRSEGDFREVVRSGAVRHVQPDVGKWGGASGCIELSRWAVGLGFAFSPHWVGGGIGLAHTLSALAAVGGKGCAELDITPNPLRTAFPTPPIQEGRVELPTEPGFGFAPDFDSIKSLRVRTS